MAVIVLCKVLLALLAHTIVLTMPAIAQSASPIIVQGNRRVDADTVQSYFRLAPGERLDDAKLDEAYKALIATGLFSDVKITHKSGQVLVVVVEAPVISRVAFEGNKRVKDEQLQAELQSKPRGTFSRAMVQADVQRIIDIYRANGRYDVRVDPKVIDLPNGRLDLVFEITEGAKTTVRTITFVGNRSFSSSRLKDVIKTGETGLLSFLKTNNLFDPDRLESDRDLLRRFYLKHGYADVRIVSAVAEYDPDRTGFLITFVIEEGDPYRFGAIEIQSNVRDVAADTLRGLLRTRSGSSYNAELVEKSVEDISIALAKRGYAFAQVRPRGNRDFEARIINITYVIEEGTRAYVERINVRGNTRTRDFVIRREFDIAEGDAYNRALVDRAERRLKNLGFFKSVKITNEPGSAPDRVVVNVDIEEQSTGEFSISGGYSTSDGWTSEISVAERNLMGRGQYAKAAVQYGQYARGFEVSYVEPYLLGYRVAAGFDIYAKQQYQNSNQVYGSETYGGTLKTMFSITENVSLQLRYSLYHQEITLDSYYNCYPYTVDESGSVTCYPASASVRQAVAAGPVVVSMPGYSLAWNMLDNNRLPTSGFYAEIKQDFAGAGGDVNFIRTTGEFRTYHEVVNDLIAMLKVQGGYVTGWGGQDLRMLDHFFMGPNLVRGFAATGIGPRDLTSGSTNDALGGSIFWGASLELQYPLFFAPKDYGMRLAMFADAGTLYNYKGVTTLNMPGQVTQVISPLYDDSTIRTSAGVGLIWDSPFGPLRFDYAIPITYAKYTDPTTGVTTTVDSFQQFRFTGGTKF